MKWENYERIRLIAKKDAKQGWQQKQETDLKKKRIDYYSY